jgi:hypothetical protein
MSTHLFHVIPDSFAVLVSKRGVYRQAKLYRRGDEVFAGHGGGFIRLLHGGGTSAPDVRWDGAESDLTFVAGRLGRLLVGQSA